MVGTFDAFFGQETQTTEFILRREAAEDLVPMCAAQVDARS
jgi:hypothetical protein